MSVMILVRAAHARPLVVRPSAVERRAQSNALSSRQSRGLDQVWLDQVRCSSATPVTSIFAERQNAITHGGIVKLERHHVSPMVCWEHFWRLPAPS
jgi:hypothetical protein